MTTKPRNLLFRHDKRERDDTTPSEEYDGEREKEPMPIRVLEAIPILKPMSHHSQAQGAAPPLEDLPPIIPMGDMLRKPPCVTPFVRWIEDYPLPDGLKMPSHVGSYDRKGDPDNFLHLFEGAIPSRRSLRRHVSQCITSRIWKEKALELSLLVEFLSTDFPTSYKGLTEKTYNWIKAKEVATNGTPNDHQENFERFKRDSSWDNNKGK
ncbi:hypothetical protein Tco_0915537 [Tanacetum coccineum]